MSDFETAARDLVARQLAGRALPDSVRLTIEEAVEQQLQEGFSTEMEAALRQLIDTYAEVTAKIAAGRLESTPTDDNPPTTTDVHWTSIG